MPNTKHIIIVGGGLAGLSAAYELSQYPNYHITILEARDRVGGRVHSVPVNGIPIDMGGFIIFPWYRTLLPLIESLGLTKKLKTIPQLDILHQLAKDEPLLSGHDLNLSMITKGKVAAKLMPALVKNLSVHAPKLRAAKYATVQEFFRNGTTAIHDERFERFVTVLSESYCYPPIDRYKAAFMLPMTGNGIFFGDLTTSSYFSQGTPTLIDALYRALQKRNVTFLMSTTVTNVDDGIVYTKDETMNPDAVIVTHPLHDDHVPYTRFSTVVVRCSPPPILADKKSWGGILIHPDACKEIPIVSIIHNEKLYGKKAKGLLTLNIKMKESDPAWQSQPDAHARIAQELRRLFPNISTATLLAETLWERTMPISNEHYVAAILAKQGEHHVYYAGDFLGCPSMETAAATGIHAAKLLHHDQHTR